MNDCIFCKIIKGDIPCFKIYEDKDFLAFLDISQFTPGHTIVIPKVHKRFIWDIEDLRYFEVIRKISNHFRSLGYEYVDSASFGRMVPHAHFHLVPHNDDNRDWKDALNEIGAMQGDPNRRPSKELATELAKKFKLN